MTTEELAGLKALLPDALNVWYDRMLDLEKGKLVETLLTYMTKEQLLRFLIDIQKDIIEARKEENNEK